MAAALGFMWATIALTLNLGILAWIFAVPLQIHLVDTELALCGLPVITVALGRAMRVH